MQVRNRMALDSALLEFDALVVGRIVSGKPVMKALSCSDYDSNCQRAVTDGVC